MKTAFALTQRNVKLFFKDKGMFLVSLITPVILIVLYVTFLGNVYRNSFLATFPTGITIEESVINGYVGGQLISSILAVSCVTVAFCSNMIMIQDKSNGVIKDITIAPVKGSALAISYYFSALFSTLIVCVTALGLCLGYVGIIGWYIRPVDIALLILDVVLLTTFGTALSSIINFFLSTQGQMSAVGTIVSSGYGYICGAYMPLSQFPEGLRKVISFLPGTYGTSLMRNHAMAGVIEEMESNGLPEEIITSLRDAIDCNLYFFGERVSIGSMYVILVTAVILLIALYIGMNVIKLKRK